MQQPCDLLCVSLIRLLFTCCERASALAQVRSLRSTHENELGTSDLCNTRREENRREEQSREQVRSAAMRFGDRAHAQVHLSAQLHRFELPTTAPTTLLSLSLCLVRAERSRPIRSDAAERTDCYRCSQVRSFFLCGRSLARPVGVDAQLIPSDRFRAALFAPTNRHLQFGSLAQSAAETETETGNRTQVQLQAVVIGNTCVCFARLN